MATPHTNGTVSVPSQVVRFVRDLVLDVGPNHAARSLGMSRHVVLAVMAGLPIRPGSLALLREAMRATKQGAKL